MEHPTQVKGKQITEAATCHGAVFAIDAQSVSPLAPVAKAVNHKTQLNIDSACSHLSRPPHCRGAWMWMQKAGPRGPRPEDFGDKLKLRISASAVGPKSGSAKRALVEKLKSASLNIYPLRLLKLEGQS